jgi:uncharacterized protein YkwD
MTNTFKIIVPLFLMIFVLFSASSCGQGVSQEEYDRISQELIETEKQRATLQNSLAESVKKDAQYKALGIELEDVKKARDASLAELEALKARYENLNAEFVELQDQNEHFVGEIESIEAQYQDLKKQYEAVTQPPEPIVIEDIEQTLFELINQERVNHGIDELLWGKNLYGWTRANSREMADTLRYKYSDWASWQEILWAAGYNSTEEMARATIIIWRGNPYRYEQNIVNPGAKYGAVGVYKLGDIYYITYMASITR